MPLLFRYFHLNYHMRLQFLVDVIYSTHHISLDLILLIIEFHYLFIYLRAYSAAPWSQLVFAKCPVLSVHNSLLPENSWMTEIQSETYHALFQGRINLDPGIIYWYWEIKFLT
jgi:hypothetical protein